jgi:hypothetical protein
MAAHTVASTDVGKYELTLAANAEDIVTFGGGSGDTAVTDLKRVEVYHHSGAAPLYVRIGGTATVKGDNCWLVAPNGSVLLDPATAGDTEVHVISAAAAVYSVANGG